MLQTQLTNQQFHLYKHHANDDENHWYVYNLEERICFFCFFFVLFNLSNQYINQVSQCQLEINVQQYLNDAMTKTREYTLSTNRNQLTKKWFQYKQFSASIFSYKKPVLYVRWKTIVWNKKLTRITRFSFVPCFSHSFFIWIQTCIIRSIL